jgi:hypothetical protein
MKFMPVILSISVTAFCLAAIATRGYHEAYWSTVLFILGYWLPNNPQGRNKGGGDSL